MKNTFYTSVDRFGNKILFRGYVNGKRIHKDDTFIPTLFCTDNVNSKYKNLKGESVRAIQPGTMKDCMEYLKKREGISNYEVYGNTNYVHQFISDKFNKEKKDGEWERVINFDEGCRKLINVTTIDIEVQSDKGFPNPKDAFYEITAITLKNNIDNVYYVWALGDWNKSESPEEIQKEIVNYKKCFDEKDLLKKFIFHWVTNYPDIITGWNSRLFDMHYLVNRIKRKLGNDYAKKLSPWNLVTNDKVPSVGGDQPCYKIIGIQQLDYLQVFRKYGYTYGTQESYKLDHIASVVLGERKLDYSEYGSLYTLYKENHQKFIDYNIRDVQVVDKIEEKTNLLTLVMTVAYKSLTNLTEAFGSVGMWDSIIYNEMRTRNIVVPQKKRVEKERQIEGAHVKDPIVGMHDWVVSFDLNSLYPHLIMQYNMSPETIINKEVRGVTVGRLLEGDEFKIEKELCMTAKGIFFSKTKKGIIPELIENLYKERVEAKKLMQEAADEIEHLGEDPTYANTQIAIANAMDNQNGFGQGGDTPNQNQMVMQDKIKQLELLKKARSDKLKRLESVVATQGNIQLAIKILMNSLYGAMSNEFFRYYDIRIAESITMSGQHTIRSAEKTVNEDMNKKLKTINKDYVVAIDTDSLYINCGPIVEKALGSNPSNKKALEYLNKLSINYFEKMFDQAYEGIRKTMNCDKQMMAMKREVIATKGVWTGKKHYALTMLDSEGLTFKEPKLKVIGLESVRSSTPKPCRDLIEDTLKVIMKHGENSTRTFIENAREKFYRLPIEDVAFPRGASNINKYIDRARIYRKSTPIHVRGALLYNHYLKELGIDTKYDKIFSGDKIKFVYLKLPNRVKENVIAFTTLLPEEFKVRTSVDYETQFNKGYLDPIRTIIECIGWKLEKQATLEDFF